MDSLQNIDLENKEFRMACDLLERTSQSVFLTGKAGTGKSTFLKYICQHTKKKHVVLAPTGIAAVNVRGMTLHSFFHIPFKPLLPDDPDYTPHKIRKTLRYTKQMQKLLHDLELIIIDEISMVRADIIDHIDRILRVYSKNMREPFGGKQILFVGDVFQLEPVVTPDMKDILRRYYKSFFFFNALVFEQLSLVPIELTKIYRQSDSAFISMLDRIRINQCTKSDIVALNSQHNPNYTETETDTLAITLAPRRNTVDTINQEHMDALTTPECVFEGVIEGTFPENDLPTAKNLVLKVGAQVIFIRNDKNGRWVNGTIAIVDDITDNGVVLRLENGDKHTVDPEIWENVLYTYNEEEKKVEEQILGSFSQLPIKPAWALTVHKSQGLTFNNVVLDFTGGAFAGGQTYVALSRCTSLEGITLLRRLDERDVIVNPLVVQFSQQFNSQHLIQGAIRNAEANEHYRLASKAFDSENFALCVEHLHKAMEVKNVINEPSVQRLVAMKLSKITQLQNTIKNLEKAFDAQRAMLTRLAMEYTSMADEALNFDKSDTLTTAEDAVPYASSSKSSLSAMMAKAALANYDKALSICPELMPALCGKARLMARLGAKDTALEIIQKALKITPDNYQANMILADIHMEADDMPEAIKALKRAIRADKNAIAPHTHLVAIYDKIGLDELADAHRTVIEELRKKAANRNHKKKKKD